ncbi:sensory transduction histidine kinase [Synechocystis sp. PCC 6803]|uniref:Sensor histidine kinase Hik2 n=1 Tax=Synechocystis sp. (strain ATCC 27184 / PCC 6803 / Kazusa) TaxID=1111708 RepID=HIK2_SYNY3|nr:MULTISPECIES: two-component system sensor histidine kinase Hik2 [unclassified Synechocystis]P73276.1 RecName: Full=Sensor histidine kinase Hik2; AltName: Full=CSK [Synechocystis sp. PCC 6803 substr. Kazusa]AGF50993.1 sensory transduction histidine kinase [Synechocystis sp. PCC 6803]ALJ67037.1 histidine kinase [Synechocystis sp. PCC 6803]AVP88881.1 histidine kinase [Synechocystis sp. IPPAS B-1465]MBD2617399.1 GAF domain-containing sensor histidine kinase [Synechocystis sp. FACHB-898]MBD2639
MAGSISSMYSPSAGLISLCQSQVRLLQQGLRVDWCGVYLNQEETEQGLVPLVVSHGSTLVESESYGLISLPQGEVSPPMDDFSLPAVPVGVGQLSRRSRLEPPPFDADKRLVLPLVYGEEMVGLLVIHRSQGQWHGEEMMQLEAIAKSLAVACLLDQQQDWYRQAWEEQNQQYQWERQHWADLLHQLRNPLTALKTFSKLLLKRWHGDNKSQQVVEGIVRQGEHLQELLQSFEASQSQGPEAVPLLSSSPVTTIQVLPPADRVETMPLANFSLGEVLPPILLAHQAIAAERNITLTAQIALIDTVVMANRLALREVVNNLLDNGIKYTPNGGLVEVSLALEKVSSSGMDWATLAIADTGYGIPPEDQQKIFERNYRGVQGRGSINGTGLGLAIVADLVAQMGGKITVTSPNGLSRDPDQPGSTFTLWLRSGEQV